MRSNLKLLYNKIVFNPIDESLNLMVDGNSWKIENNIFTITEDTNKLIIGTNEINMNNVDSEFVVNKEKLFYKTTAKGGIDVSLFPPYKENNNNIVPYIQVGGNESSPYTKLTLGYNEFRVHGGIEDGGNGGIGMPEINFALTGASGLIYNYTYPNNPNFAAVNLVLNNNVFMTTFKTPTENNTAVIDSSITFNNQVFSINNSTNSYSDTSHTNLQTSQNTKMLLNPGSFNVGSTYITNTGSRMEGMTDFNMSYTEGTTLSTSSKTIYTDSSSGYNSKMTLNNDKFAIDILTNYTNIENTAKLELTKQTFVINNKYSGSVNYDDIIQLELNPGGMAVNTSTTSSKDLVNLLHSTTNFNLNCLEGLNINTNTTNNSSQLFVKPENGIKLSTTNKKYRDDTLTSSETYLIDFTSTAFKVNQIRDYPVGSVTGYPYHSDYTMSLSESSFNITSEYASTAMYMSGSESIPYEYQNGYDFILSTNKINLKTKETTSIDYKGTTFYADSLKLEYNGHYQTYNDMNLTFEKIYTSGSDYGCLYFDITDGTHSITQVLSTSVEHNEKGIFANSTIEDDIFVIKGFKLYDHENNLITVDGIQSIIEDYLPLSGGTMTGDITADNTLKLKNFAICYDDTTVLTKSNLYLKSDSYSVNLNSGLFISSGDNSVSVYPYGVSMSYKTNDGTSGVSVSAQNSDINMYNHNGTLNITNNQINMNNNSAGTLLLTPSKINMNPNSNGYFTLAYDTTNPYINFNGGNGYFNVTLSNTVSSLTLNGSPCSFALRTNQEYNNEAGLIATTSNDTEIIPIIKGFKLYDLNVALSDMYLSLTGGTLIGDLVIDGKNYMLSKKQAKIDDLNAQIQRINDKIAEGTLTSEQETVWRQGIVEAEEQLANIDNNKEYQSYNISYYKADGTITLKNHDISSETYNNDKTYFSANQSGIYWYNVNNTSSYISISDNGFYKYNVNSGAINITNDELYLATNDSGYMKLYRTGGVPELYLYDGKKHAYFNLYDGLYTVSKDTNGYAIFNTKQLYISSGNEDWLSYNIGSLSMTSSTGYYKGSFTITPVSLLLNPSDTSYANIELNCSNGIKIYGSNSNTHTTLQPGIIKSQFYSAADVYSSFTFDQTNLSARTINGDTFAFSASQSLTANFVNSKSNFYVGASGLNATSASGSKIDFTTTEFTLAFNNNNEIKTNLTVNNSNFIYTPIKGSGDVSLNISPATVTISSAQLMNNSSYVDGMAQFQINPGTILLTSQYETKKLELTIVRNLSDGFVMSQTSGTINSSISFYLADNRTNGYLNPGIYGSTSVIDKPMVIKGFELYDGDVLLSNKYLPLIGGTLTGSLTISGHDTLIQRKEDRRQELEESIANIQTRLPNLEGLAREKQQQRLEQEQAELADLDNIYKSYINLEYDNKSGTLQFYEKYLEDENYSWYLGTYSSDTINLLTKAKDSDTTQATTSITTSGITINDSSAYSITLNSRGLYVENKTSENLTYTNIETGSYLNIHNGGNNISICPTEIIATLTDKGGFTLNNEQLYVYNEKSHIIIQPDNGNIFLNQVKNDTTNTFSVSTDSNILLLRSNKDNAVSYELTGINNPGLFATKGTEAQTPVIKGFEIYDINDNVINANNFISINGGSVEGHIKTTETEFNEDNQYITKKYTDDMFVSKTEFNELQTKYAELIEKYNELENRLNSLE